MRQTFVCPGPRSPTAALALIAGTALVLSCFSERQEATGPDPSLGDCRVPIDSSFLGSTRAFVVIRNFDFGPDTVRVAPGTTVTWVNCEDPGIESHTTTSDGGVWNSGLLPPGSAFSQTFDLAGSFPYHCEPHPFMRATIVVE